jgi:hypothetical protein
MAERNPWQPKPWLEERPWSLLPNVGLPAWAAPVALAVWLVAVAVVQLAVPPGWVRVLSSAIAGAWSIYYMACRLAGRPAPTGGASPSIRVGSPFQARLAFDIAALLVFATAVALLFAQ